MRCSSKEVLTCIAILLCRHMDVLILSEELVEGTPAFEDTLQGIGWHLHEAYSVSAGGSAYLGLQLLGSPAVVGLSSHPLSLLPSLQRWYK